MKKHGVGVIGCGTISQTYLTNLTSKFSILKVVGVSDLIPERSAAKAEAFGVRQMTNAEIYACDEIEVVVNLTNPTSHYEVSRDALLAGKHVYSEKMAAVTMAEADELTALAEARGLYYTVAPDTFLGGGLQTCRRLIDSGLIGEPRTASAFLMRGVYLWFPHDDVKFLSLLPGGGIPFDMGGYYLAALMNMLGPLSRVTGFARQVDQVYQNVDSARFGETQPIDTINMLAAALEFKNGVIGTITTSSEGFPFPQRLEVHGTEGALVCPDPNTFGGPVLLYRKSASLQEPCEIPLTHGYFAGCNRGLGVADLCWALENGRKPRLVFGYHCFEAIHGIWQSGRDGTVHRMHSTFERPAPLPSGYVRPEVMEAALAL